MRSRLPAVFGFSALIFLSVAFSPGENRASFSTLPAKDDSLISEAELSALFSGDGTDHGHFARKTFYSWTSKEQVDELRSGGTLLRKSKADDGAISVYDAALLEHRFDKSPVAQLLRGPSFAKKRYAWCNPWATVETFSNEDYGDHLLEIVLEDSAYVVGFFPGEKEPFRVFEAGGKPVPVAEALKHPERWAAVYHVNETPKRGWGKAKHDGTRLWPGKRFSKQVTPFREYVIINERMIRQWSYATPVLKEVLAQDVLKFRKLEYYCETADTASGSKDPFQLGYNGQYVIAVWQNGIAEKKFTDVLWHGLAFAGSRYFSDVHAHFAEKDLAEKWKEQGTAVMDFPSRRYK
ncbi:MAG: hypothetical protein FD123_1651 [Bacteroidetes bacterium]|nr:MAG: hypothetical protein FD123_1651 [Bacteroidota bacterium]